MFALVVWARKDCIKEVGKKLGDSGVYEEVSYEPEPLINTIHRTKRKLKKEQIWKKNQKVKDQKFARFFMLPKIHKRLNNVPDTLVTSNCVYYMENISAFLDSYLQSLA